ncbi:DUF1631 domain-containing protein [Pseudoxanthomonas sp. SGNA-20]|uniref:DUF1631 domain-containing protein n=1 Tax=Pseudoxanthomonas sp. SGNA-20 TaxID=2493088 RepID=UPI000F63610D|nr:DUF1631 domain-containing protein [Pseudoxanthomonas sp. SGNA-20]RRN58912.1 DUF1631 domain-containing protein [Pseudoxanthomonas sp. SGNA-20]
MQATNRPTPGHPAFPALADAALPARVRAILLQVRELAATQLGPWLEATLDGLENQLFSLAEGARSSSEQAERLDAMRLLRQHRAAFQPRFLAALEGSLAGLRAPPPAEPAEPAEPAPGPALALVEDTELDRAIVLREIARRQVQRGGSELLLLAQRFAVLAATPAFELEQLPLGPHALCQCLRTAGDALQLPPEAQLLLYRQFERQVMDLHGEFARQLNALLDRAGVLPGLVYTPYRPPCASAPQRRSTPAQAANRPRPMTGWHGQGRGAGWGRALAGLPGGMPPGAAAGTAPAAAAGEATPAIASADGDPKEVQAAFAAMRELLAAHRAATRPAAPGPAVPPQVLPPQLVTQVLGSLQSLPLARARGQRRRTMQDLREATLARLRAEHGPAAALPPEHEDAFDLLSILYQEIGRQVRGDAPAQDLLERLQVPLARAALQDQGFFVAERHPARELLNAVAESGATWLGEDDADPQLVQRLEQVVQRVVEAYDGDPAVFELANQEVQEQQRAMLRKAEVSERRQVEAARGRDRLAGAKHQADAAIRACLAGRRPPQFAQALLNQAWADVLTLTALRHGEGSPEWRERTAATARIVEVTCDPEAAPDPALGTQIEAALRQVGYHEDEAGAIARRLSRSEDDEVTSRTELTARLKARARLGEDAARRSEPLPPRSAGEQACYEQVRALPFGTWFEFSLGAQGEVRRQRLSWYSPVTDHALFVNTRGQKVAEHSLDALARMMAAGQARVVTEERSRLVDRAWHATLRLLRGLAGRAEPAPSGAGA